MTGWFPRLLAVTLATQFVTQLLRPVLSYHALSLGAGTAEIGIVVASFSVLSLVLTVPIGSAVDKHGERWFLVAGTVTLIVAICLLLAAHGIPMLIAGSAMLGLSQTVAMISCQTVIANGISAQRRDRRFAAFTVVTSLAQFTAPAAGGLLLGMGAGAAEQAFTTVYTVSGLATLLGLLVAFSIAIFPGTLTDRRRRSVVSRTSGGRLRAVIKVPSVMVAIVVGFAVLSAVDLLTAFLPVFGEIMSISPVQIGFLIGTHGLASIAVRLFLVHLTQRFDRRALLTVALMTAALSIAVVPFVEVVPVLYLLMALSGAGLGVCQPISMSWVAGAVQPEVRGTAMSLRMAGNRLGQTLVPLGVSAVAGSAGAAVAFVGPAGILAIAGGLVIFSGRWRRDGKGPDSHDEGPPEKPVC